MSAELEHLLGVRRGEQRVADAAIDLICLVVAIGVVGAWQILAWIL